MPLQIDLRLQGYDRSFHGALLDANIFADVYIHLTGGQSKFEFITSNANLNSESQSSDLKIDFNKYPIPKVMVSKEDILTHDQRIIAINSKRESIMTKVTRFAPSPTGTLHIGGVRTALFNYVYAKQNKGKFFIRIEDTDTERSTREFEQNILKGLSDLGINPDEPPVRQSERSKLYQHAVKQIIDSGKAYYCNCSKERLDRMRSKQQSKGLKPQYDGKCRNLNLVEDASTVLRLKHPKMES